jgi:hypothetical protein
VFVVVFRLGADYSIQRLRPERGAAQALAPGRAGVLRVSDVPLALRSYPPDRAHPERIEQRVIYKIFVLSESIALDALQLPALSETLARPDPSPAPATRATGRLGGLLTSVRYAGTRRLRPVSAAEDDHWHTRNIELNIRQEPSI